MKKISRILLSYFLVFSLLFSFFSSNEMIRLESNQKLFTQGLEKNKRTIKNIIVFIEFSDNDQVVHHLDDEQSVENAYKIFNSDELFEMDTVNGMIKVPSFKKYYQRESYGDLIITSEIFPKENGKVVSYKDSHPIGYYLKYNDQNPIGYKDKTESLKRETELVNHAISYIAPIISSFGFTEDEIDSNYDGKVDSISFIVEGQKNLPSSISWNDLLWSHKLDNTGITTTILGKQVTSYTLLYAEDYTEAAGLFSLNRGTYGTIIHEYGHMLGYMDLYRYNDPNSKPVGFYDIMGSTIGSNPQGFLSYYISEYHPNTSWHNPLPVIDKSTNNITVYKPNYIDKDEKRAIKIQIGENTEEYFVVEYHDKMNTYESYSADESGIIIYRVNEKNKYLGGTDGSNQGKNDHVYIFRPNETSLGAGLGNLRQATLNLNRPVFGSEVMNNLSFDNQSIFFSDGSNSGIKIEVTGQTDHSVTFNVTFPKVDGSGTENDPYVISSPESFIYLMGLGTKGKYYKLMNDLDFKNVTDYPRIEFTGNLDGNHKTIRNIKTNGSGVFNRVGDYPDHTIIKDLTIENIEAYTNLGDYFGGFSGTAENVTLYNIHLKNGTVKNEGISQNDIVSTGGFVGNVDQFTIIEDCSSNLDVIASKNVGGFIGINRNAKMKNSFSTGTVTGNSKVGAFIGIQAIQSTYHVPDHVYYSKNENINAVGGYFSSFHDLTILDEKSLSKGIQSIFFPKELTVSKNMTSNLPIDSSINYIVEIENKNILKYENNKLMGLEIGQTKLYVDVLIGNNKMRLETNVVVKEQGEDFTESEVLDYLGLIKKENYVVGFLLETKISDIKKNISNYKGITLKSFKNNNGVEMNDGIVATGMSFTLNFHNKDYTYIIVIKGDVNGDGLIYATDYVKVKNHIMGRTRLTGAFLEAADINNDKNIYATDYVQIKNHIMGKTQIIQK